jgi:hypothetical protein
MHAMSPELVLVSPPAEAELARATLAPPPPARYERARPSVRALATLYAVCLVLTGLPVALLVVAQR